ncbi:PHD-like zinc-binding domain containing protein [Novymonas esmeraldas]|uniref:PHD-like zinc-binding domain containing protein n=1 Tax=Novymonas esmeraldas TaxID=1808958 RepID=A0AAW0EQQ9_9TRYP
MGRVRVGLRLRFVKLPQVDGERVFRDVIAFAEPDDIGYDDLRALVEAKIHFMELGHRDFTVFHAEESTGDRLVVDTAYFGTLARQWARKAAKARPQPHHAPAPVIRGPALLGESPVLPHHSAPQAPSEYGALSASPTNHRHESSGNFGDDEEDDERPPDVLQCFEVELHGNKSGSADPAALLGRLGSAPLAAAASSMPFATLTRENLARLCTSDRVTCNAAAVPVASAAAAAPPSASSPDLPNASGEAVLVRVRELTCPPVHARFYLRCVVLAVRFKTPKPGVTVAELDLGDAADVAEAITAVTFDEAVHKAVRDHLRGDRRQVLELRQVYVRRKSDVDVRYQTNPHPLLLRLDRSSKLEVVRILATPAPLPGSGAVVTVRDRLDSAGVVDVSHIIQHQQQQQQYRSHPRPGGAVIGLPSSESGASVNGGGGGAYPPTWSSSSSSSGPRRTTFTMSHASGNAGASAALVSGVVPSILGNELRHRQEMLLRQQRPADAAAPEPGMPLVTAHDVREREPLIEQHANREEERKQRIRRKAEVSTQCLLCGLDCSDEATCMAVVRQQLTRSSRNRGSHVPTFEQVKQDLCDRRRVPAGEAATRLLCAHTFVNSATRTVHVVHPRCAHLCTAYQGGDELEDIVVCDLSMNVCALCGMPGACVGCYHPQCTEMYHVVCALYSGGYVNFGQRDPYLPCPACPRHTQVVVPARKPPGSVVLHVDHSCWEDGVAFDSRVVESTDLRDPDENDGQ